MTVMTASNEDTSSPVYTNPVVWRRKDLNCDFDFAL